MKTKLMVIRTLAACMLILSPVFLRADDATSNLIENGGFETSSLAPWQDFSTGATVTDSGANAGKYCVKLKAGSGIKCTITGLKPNTTYVFSGMARVDSTGDQVRLTAQLDDQGRGAVTKMVATTEWSPASVTITTGANDTSVQCVLWKDANMGNGSAYGDAFKLVPQ